MRKQERNESKKSSSEQNPLGGSESQLPIIVSARTGLAGKDEAILRRVPVNYAEKTVKEALDYITGANLKDSELSLAESVKKELKARGSVVVVNGKTAKLNDCLDKYIVEKEHKLPDGTKKKYRELEIEVSAVHQGGLYSLLK